MKNFNLVFAPMFGAPNISTLVCKKGKNLMNLSLQEGIQQSRMVAHPSQHSGGRGSGDL